MNEPVPLAPATTWPEPDLSFLSDGRPAPPAFPLDALGPWAGWASDLAESKSAPADYAATGLLAAGAACLGDVRHVSPWAGWQEPPALWLAMVGDPSASKSPIFGPIVEVLHALEVEENAGFSAARRDFEADRQAAAETCEIWEAAVKAAMKKGEKRPGKPEAADEPEALTPARMVTSDSTREALAALFKSNPRGLILVRDELAGFIADFDKYGGGGEAAFYLSRFNGQALTIDRKRDGHVTVPRALLSIFGGIQPEPLRELLFKRADDGFVSRFLFAFPDPVRRARPAVRADMDTLKVALRRLRHLAFAEGEDGRPVAKVTPLSREAAVVFEGWWQENGDEAADAMGFTAGALGKAPGVVARLALDLEYLDWAAGPADAPEPEAVGELAIFRAITLFQDYFAPMARRVFGGADIGKDELRARALLRYARRERLTVANVQELRGVAGLRTTDDVKAALTVLEGAGWVRFMPTRGGGSKGRLRQEWGFNPDLWCEP
jgi:Protein of unknown function (DUF3987)